jgi:hypothetical protein
MRKIVHDNRKRHTSGLYGMTVREGSTKQRTERALMPCTVRTVLISSIPQRAVCTESSETLSLNYRVNCLR